MLQSYFCLCESFIFLDNEQWNNKLTFVILSAIKYMGTDDGGPGGVLLHVHSNTGELAHTNVEERVAR